MNPHIIKVYWSKIRMSEKLLPPSSQNHKWIHYVMISINHINCGDYQNESAIELLKYPLRRRCLVGELYTSRVLQMPSSYYWSHLFISNWSMHLKSGFCCILENSPSLHCKIHSSIKYKARSSYLHLSSNFLNLHMSMQLNLESLLRR